MLGLQQEYSELSPFENSSQNIYSQNLKKQRQRKIRANSNTYFSSFSNFKILHLLIKSFVIPTPNKVFGALKNHLLKSNLKNLKNLNSSKNLKIDRIQTKQTIIHTRKLKCISLLRIVLFGIPLRRDEVSPPDVYNSSLQERIIRLVQFLDLLFCGRDSDSHILTILHIRKIFNIQTTPNQWIKEK